MDKCIVTIDLKKHLEDFLIHDFGTDKTGVITINKRSHIGRYIDAMWEASDKPPESAVMENPVRLALPVTGKDWYSICKIGGTPCQPLQFTDSSQDNNEANKHTVQMASILRGPALGRIPKNLIPATDNDDINSVLGLGAGSGGLEN